MTIEAIHTDFANFIIAHQNNMLYSLDITNIKESFSSNFAHSLKQELNEYFRHQRHEFSIKYFLNQSPFALAVLNALTQIPYGSTVCYKDLAKLAGYPNAYRAVGNVMHTNPLPIIIPCHRVVAANGIGGYSYGVDMKLKLLELEGVDINQYKH